MRSTAPQDHITAFTEELLRTGLGLGEVAADLVEALPADSYPGEEPARVVLEMVTGTIRTCLVHADERDVEVATELIIEARERVLEHLQLALALSRRMHDDEGDDERRAYG
jgi:hypothetical protein